MFEIIKNKICLSNLLFIAVCLVIAVYSSRYPVYTSGIIMLMTGGYILIRSISVGKLDFDMTMMFLFTAFVIKAMLDQHTGKAWKVPSTLAMPVMLYLFGKLIATGKQVKSDFGSQIRIWVAVIAMAIGMALFGFSTQKATVGTDVESLNYYYMAYANGVVINEHTYLFNYIPVIGIAIAAICGLIDRLLTLVLGKKEKLIKFKCIPFVVAGLVALGMFFKWYHGDIRYPAFREALDLMITQHWGNFHFTLLPIDTSCNMWLDYGRESGAMVMIPLAIYLVLSVLDAIKMLFNRRLSVATKVLLIWLFVVFNIYYWIESTAFVYQYLWYFGLMVSGMIGAVKEN